MADEPTTPPAENNPPASPDPPQDPPKEDPSEAERTFSQRDVDKIAGNRATEERNKLLRDLGVEDFDSLKSLVSAESERAEQEKSELTKAQEAQQATQAQLDQAYEQIAELRMDTAIRDALSEAGVKPERMKAAARQIDAGSLDVDDDGNITGAEEAVKALREGPDAIPEFFGSTQRVSPDTTPRETPPVDFQNMSREDFEKLQQRALSGEEITIP